MKQKFEKIKSSHTAAIIVIIMILALYWIRMIHLDQDMPPWGVGFYQPKDEGCYAVLAINEMEYGCFYPDNPLAGNEAYPMYLQEHIRVDLLGNLLEIAGFRLFGDNYYGLRTPMVFVGFLSLLLTLWTLLLMRKECGNRRTYEIWMIPAILLIQSVHFAFYLASRSVEPSAHRMIFVQLLILVWFIFKKNRRLCFFLLGGVITISVFFIYITNVFLYLVIAWLLLLIWWKENFKSCLKDAVFFALGSIIILAVAELYYIKVWNTFAIRNLLNAIGLFRDVIGYKLATEQGLSRLLFQAVKGSLKYVSANYFLYGPTLLFGACILVPFLMWKIFSEKNLTACIFLGIPAALLLQTMVSEDYIWRKLIVIAPVFLYWYFWGMLSSNELTKNIKSWREQYLNIKWMPLRKTVGILLDWYIPLSILVVFVSVLFHLKITNDPSKVDIAASDKLMIVFAGCMPVVLWFVYCQYLRLTGKEWRLRIHILTLGVPVILLNLFFLTKYVWIHPEYKERDMMISLSKDYGLDGKYITGDFTMGITLYNDLKPIYENSENYGSRLVENPDLLLYHYATDVDGIRDYIDNTVFDSYSPYTAKEIIKIPGSFQTFGDIRNFALYQAAPRTLVKEEMQEEKKDYSVKIANMYQKIQDLDENNRDYDTETLLSLRKSIKREAEDLESFESQGYEQYGNVYGISTAPVYHDIFGNIFGDISTPVYGRIYGNVYGNIESDLYGEIYGDIYGDINGIIYGDIYGDVYGHVSSESFEKIHGTQRGTNRNVREK